MELHIELIPAQMPMAVTFVETVTKAAGMPEAETGMLVLSAEELFMTLCNSMPGVTITLRCRDRRHAVDMLLQIPQAPPDLRIFNITARLDHDSDQGLEQMGLYLASRACDQFGIRQLPMGGWEIMLRKERRYPAQSADTVPLPVSLANLLLTTTPAPEAVKQLSLLIAQQYAAFQFPEQFTPCGRLLDKLASDVYGVVLAHTENGIVAGGLLWRTDGERIVECFGPYLNVSEGHEQLSTLLCEKAVEQFGRSNRLGLVLYAPQRPPASAGFEEAGSLTTPSGSIWTGYCMLAEEFGAAASVPDALRPWYQEFCSSMALARQVHCYHDNGEGGDGLTLFAARLDRGTGMARLTPLLVGRDAAAVLAAHLELLESDGFSSVYCCLDTGHPFDALLAPYLLQQGFTPCLLVPWGGSGDLIHLVRNGSRQ